MRRFLAAIVILAVIGASLFWLVTKPSRVGALPAYSPNPENGKLMFYAGGCAACHATPDQDDATKLGGGAELKSPFGTFYAPNISSDRNDGIGAWTETDFVNAVWKGTSPDGRHYFPVFPYSSYQRMRITDIRDLFAFLKTLPAVQGRARGHDLRFPYNVRRLVGGWKFLFVDSLTYTYDPAQSPQWNRGAYLVAGPGHCVECHSPRNALGGIVASQRFAGGPTADGEGWVPNITPAGIGSYSVGDIERILATGVNPDGDSVGGDMAKVVRNMSQLSKEDRTAIATFVKSLPPVQGPKPPEKK